MRDVSVIMIVRWYGVTTGTIVMVAKRVRTRSGSGEYFTTATITLPSTAPCPLPIGWTLRYTPQPRPLVLQFCDDADGQVRACNMRTRAQWAGAVSCNSPELFTAESEFIARTLLMLFSLFVLSPPPRSLPTNGRCSCSRAS